LQLRDISAQPGEELFSNANLSILAEVEPRSWGEPFFARSFGKMENPIGYPTLPD
jgi:hypothetical protein